MPFQEEFRFDGSPIREPRFHGDAMLMYGWVASRDLRIQSWNASLQRWICDNSIPFLSTPECHKRLEEGNLELKDWFRCLLHEEDEGVGEIIECELRTIRDEWNSLVGAVQDPRNDKRQTVKDKMEGDYSVIRTITLVDGSKLLAGVRLVKPAGVRMRSKKQQDRVDLINVCLIDETGQIRGFQGQLQEAWTRVELVRREATNAAIATIMARNMSHNIGSHVLARLATPEAVQGAIFEEDFLDAVTRTPLKELLVEDHIWDATRKVGPLNEFLRMRMDFIADIATAQRPPAPARVSLLWDALLPFARQTLLLTNLCASHGLAYKDITFRIILGGASADIVQGQLARTQHLDPALAAIAVSVPNGPVGVQALCCNIENLLRNAVKHSRPPGKERGIQITIRICPEEDFQGSEDLMRVVVYDNWKVCLSDTCVADKLNKSLRDRFTGEDGSVSASNRGLKEMKAAAAYLRGVSPVHADEGKVEPPFLKAVSIDGNVGYELALLRPKDLLVVDSSSADGSELGLLRKQGIEIVDNATAMLKRAPRFGLLLLNKPQAGLLAALQNSAPGLPPRVIIVNEEKVDAMCANSAASLAREIVSPNLSELLGSLKSGNGATAIASAWELWTNVLCQKHLPKLWIFEDSKKVQWNVGSVSRLIGAKMELDENDRIMLYARHGHPDGLSKSIVFYEPYGKGIDPISFVLENPPPQEESRKALVYQLMEAGLIPVIIVDERVQEAAGSETREFASHPEEGKRELDFWLKFMGVYVPPKGKSIWKARTSARSGWSIGST
jgi:hypothetical protein